MASGFVLATGAQDEPVDLNVGKIFCRGLAVLNEKGELGVWLACTTAKPEERSTAKVRNDERIGNHTTESTGYQCGHDGIDRGGCVGEHADSISTRVGRPQ